MHLSAAYYIAHCSFIHAIIKEEVVNDLQSCNELEKAVENLNKTDSVYFSSKFSSDPSVINQCNIMDFMFLHIL